MVDGLTHRCKQESQRQDGLEVKNRKFTCKGLYCQCRCLDGWLAQEGSAVGCYWGRWRMQDVIENQVAGSHAGRPPRSNASRRCPDTIRFHPIPKHRCPTDLSKVALFEDTLKIL
jgi:hypothetical protein